VFPGTRPAARGRWAWRGCKKKNATRWRMAFPMSLACVGGSDQA